MKNNGFIFEFYGKWTYGSLLKDDIQQENSLGLGGLFSFGKENPVNIKDMGIRCYFRYPSDDEKNFIWSGDWGDGTTSDPNFVSDYTKEGARNAVLLPLSENIIKNINGDEDIFITFSIDTSKVVSVDGVDYMKTF